MKTILAYQVCNIDFPNVDRDNQARWIAAGDGECSAARQNYFNHGGASVSFRPAILDNLDKIEEAIRLFDSHYDVHQLYSNIVELLQSVPRPDDADSTDLRWQYAYLGASWAQIVTSVDLTYELGLGYGVHEKSLPIAEHLFQSMPEHPTDRVLGLQIVVRWFDASAKLFYRTGDHTTARAYWDKCLSVLEPEGKIRESLSFLYPDIKSSSLRNEFEELRQTTENKSPASPRTKHTNDTSPAAAATPQSKKSHEEADDKLRSDLALLATKEVAYFEETKKDLANFLSSGEGSPTEIMSALTVRERERLRGLANLYQNSFQPEKVERIAELTGDQLRLMQSLHELARQQQKIIKGELDRKDAVAPNDAFAVASKAFAKATYLWKRVRDSAHWRRGQYFARQNLAILERDYAELLAKIHNTETSASSNHLFSCLSELIRLIDDIQSVRGTSNADYAKYAEITDVDLHGWTVTFAYETLVMLKSRENLTDREKLDRAALELRVIEELEQLVHQHRRVIRVGVYKQAFAKYYRKHYHRILRHYYDLVTKDGKASNKVATQKTSSGVSSPRFRKLISWIEESSSRELLDMVAARRREMRAGLLPTGEAGAGAKGGPARKYAKQVQKSSGASESRMLRRLHRADITFKERVAAACMESERLFDEFAKKNPIAATAIPPDIETKARAFADKEKSIIIRFFQMGEKDRENNDHFGAVVFAPGQEPRIVNLGASQTSIDDAIRSIGEVLKATDEAKAKAEMKVHLPKVGHAVGDVLQAICPALRNVAAAREADEFENIIVIPVGKLWKLPFHAAIVNDQFLCKRVTVIYSMSISSLIEHGRWEAATKKTPPGPLGVCTSLYAPNHGKNEVFGELILSCNRNAKEHVRHYGPFSSTDGSFAFSAKVTRDNLQKLITENLAILYLGCHGVHYEDDISRTCLVFHNSLETESSADKPSDNVTQLITPEELALMKSKQDIPLVILAACVSGQGVGMEGGEVSGFYRAMAAMGANAAMLSYWPVESYPVDAFSQRVIYGMCAEGNSSLEGYKRAIRLTVARPTAKIVTSDITDLCALGYFI